jgi:type III pantothenate kinase
MSAMWLVIDVGNTNITMGVFENGRLNAHWRLSTNHVRTIDESWAILSTLCNSAGINSNEIKGVAISSVVPDLSFVWEKLSQYYMKIIPLSIKHDSPGIPEIKIDDPQTVGADRLCNVIAVCKHFRRPAIIVDFGTATTLDVVDAEGAFLGGLILPGIQTALKELHERAAMLPKIALNFPETVIGKSTEHAMQSGILFGTIAQIEGLVVKIRVEMLTSGVSESPIVVSTGGFSRMISRHTQIIDVHVPYLVLYGIALVYCEANKCTSEIKSKLIREMIENHPEDEE